MEAIDSPPGFDADNTDEVESGKLRELELYKEDAEGWLYRGEGAANIVLAYHGSRPAFIGRVLRIRKVSSHDSKPKPSTAAEKAQKPILSEDEQKLWREWPAMADATTPAAMAHIYASSIIQPLLGQEHVDAGVLVYLTPEFLETVNHDIAEKRPEWRQKDAHLDLTGGTALLITDHSSFYTVPGRVEDLPPTITVEIKPKWGCLPTAGTISEENNIKKHVSRFSMHQHLKLKQGKISSLSKYSPLDLFSGNTDGIHKALLALFETPQNNLRIFMDGVEIFGGPEDGGSTEEAISILEEQLQRVSAAPKGQRVVAFQRLVAHMLHTSKILESLLYVQQLDEYDIEGAIVAYHNFLKPDADTGTGDISLTNKSSHGTTNEAVGPGNTKIDNLVLEKEGKHIDRDLDWVQSLSWDESRRVVRNYLIAATAKDCGLMLTLRPLYNNSGKPFPVPSTFVTACPTTTQQFVYKIALLDMDLKRLKKMPFYLSLDNEIVSTYKESVQEP
jgi:inositol-pentakisphosphate 2-kinase